MIDEPNGILIKKPLCSICYIFRGRFTHDVFFEFVVDRGFGKKDSKIFFGHFMASVKASIWIWLNT